MLENIEKWESENEADTNYAEKRSYLGDRAPTPFCQTSKYGLCKKGVLHFLATASMSTNQTLSALGCGFERRMFWCIYHSLQIVKSRKTEKPEMGGVLTRREIGGGRREAGVQKSTPQSRESRLE